MRKSLIASCSSVLIESAKSFISEQAWKFTTGDTIQKERQGIMMVHTSD